MEITLMLKGSASQIAMVLASLPDGISADVREAAPMPAPAAAPVALAPPAVVPPMPIAAPAGDDGDDDSGPTNATAPAVDASGLPWDERIHAKTKAMTDNGMWRKRRNVSADVITAVETSLRGAAPAGVPAMPPVAAAPVAAPAMSPVAGIPAMPAPEAAPVAAPTPLPVPVAAPMAMSPVAAPMAMPPVAAAPPPPMPAPEPAPVAAAPEPAAAPAGQLDFMQFMTHLSTQMGKRDANGLPLVHADYLSGITAEISTAFAPQGIAPLTAITDIASNPNMITYASQLMQRDGRW